MGDTSRDREYELTKHMRELENQIEQIETSVNAMWQKEEDEDIALTMSNRRLEQMGSNCTSEDGAILQLMDEKQQIMRGIRNKKTEFATEFESEYRKKRQQIEEQIEDIHTELLLVQEQHKEENKTN
jgi:creatinine amidohydrolase/Fe(II)-dependent formamide hydrolase-like protein